MPANLNDMLKPAREKNKAVGLFNTCSLKLDRGMPEAAEELLVPVIIGTAEILLPVASLEIIADLLLPKADRASLPVVVHLNLGLREETCRRALDLDFCSIMYDCSTDSYEVNVQKIGEMAKLAHSYHATIAVGTAHGAYKLPPKLDFDRIRQIASVIDTFLVLHGGSGLSDEDFHRAIRKDISKVNIFTDINHAVARVAYETYAAGKELVTDQQPAMVEAIKQATMEKNAAV